MKFNDFEIITRSRSVPVAVSSRSDLERLSIALLQSEIPLPKRSGFWGYRSPRCRATTR
jgi:DNA polymerase-4